jgi:hypothetical protein
MSQSCMATPLSWLVLERYELGELAPTERERVDEHLGHCPVCKACLDRIVRDKDIALPKLAAIRKTAPPPEQGFFLRWRWRIAEAALALAAVVLLLVVLWPGLKPARLTAVPAARLTIKGGELSLSLVRERNGVILHQPQTFSREDRFKLEITCPLEPPLFGEIIVIQDEEVTFPLSPPSPLACGNHVSLQGAFRLTGRSQAIICLVVSEAPVPRADLRRQLLSLPSNKVCSVLSAD